MVLVAVSMLLGTGFVGVVEVALTGGVVVMLLVGMILVSGSGGSGCGRGGCGRNRRGTKHRLSTALTAKWTWLDYDSHVPKKSLRRVTRTLGVTVIMMESHAICVSVAVQQNEIKREPTQAHEFAQEDLCMISDGHLCVLQQVFGPNTSP